MTVAVRVYVLSAGTLLVIDCILHTLDARTQCCFIPMVLCAHPDGALFMVASEKGVILCFDIALTPIRYIVCIKNLRVQLIEPCALAECF